METHRHLSLTSSYVQSAESPRVSVIGFWTLLLLLWLLGFVVQHDLYFPLFGVQSLHVMPETPEQMANAASEGRLIRRLALPAMALVGLVLLILYGRRRIIISGTLGWAMLALFAWMAASVLWSEEPHLAARRLVAFASLMICAFGVAAYLTDQLARFVIAFCGLNLLVGIAAELALGTMQPGVPGYRFSGSLHPNLQGVNLSLLILACFAMLSENPLKWRLLLIGGILVSGTFLLLTQSRTAIGALALALTATYSLKLVRAYGLGSLALPITIMSATASLVLLGGLLFPDFSAVEQAFRLIEVARDSGNPASLTGRVDIWNTIISFAATRPVLGHGYDTFWSEARVLEISGIHDFAINQAHNTYLDMFTNLGMVGLVLYGIVLVSGWTRSVQPFLKKNEAYALHSSVLVYGFFHGFMESLNALPLFAGFAAFVVLFQLGLLRGVASR